MVWKSTDAVGIQRGTIFIKTTDSNGGSSTGGRKAGLAGSSASARPISVGRSSRDLVIRSSRLLGNTRGLESIRKIGGISRSSGYNLI